MWKTNRSYGIVVAGQLALVTSASVAVTVTGCSFQEPGGSEAVASADAAIVQAVDAADLYFRFWRPTANGCEVSDQVVRITDTPHYRFAQGKYQLLLQDEPGAMPAGTNYEEYAKWEDMCYPGHGIYESHRQLAFSNNIETWYSKGWGGQDGFNTQSHPLEVARLPDVLQQGENTRYFILDGAHRAAYSASIHPNEPIYVTVVPSPAHWAAATAIRDSIEAVVDFPVRVANYVPPAAVCRLVLRSSGTGESYTADETPNCDCPTL